MVAISFRRVETDDHPWIIARHTDLYREADGFDDSFGTLVASILTEFAATHDPARETGVLALAEGRPVGCIFCARQSDTVAKLRLFLVEPDFRGHGLGRQLVRSCLGFAQASGYRRLTLWTHESHRAACALYASEGFTLQRSHPVRSFGQDLVEQHWEITLDGRRYSPNPLAIAGVGL